MALLRFFKLPRNQKFDYKPRYWNPEKEALEERLSKYKEGNKGDTQAVKTRLARGFKQNKGAGIGYKVSREIRAKEARRSNKILMFTIIALVFIAYLLFEVYLEEIIKALE
jgi:hypothetical protein